MHFVVCLKKISTDRMVNYQTNSEQKSKVIKYTITA